MNKSHLLKFFIGFIAGLCAALFPRLIAELSTSSDVVTLFEPNYIKLSLLFAMLIGAVTAIFEWESNRIPKDVFMSALAIPGIMSGALSTSASVQDFASVEAENIKYVRIIEQSMGIPTLGHLPTTQDQIIPPLPTREIHGTQSSTQAHKTALAFSLISPAYAYDTKSQSLQQNLGVSIRKRRESFVIVLDQAQSAEEAETKVLELSEQLPVEIYAKDDNQFFVITKDGPQSKADALIDAIEVKNAMGLSPSLLKVK